MTEVRVDLCFTKEKICEMRIIGTGRVHPSTIVTNAMLEKFLDTNDEWIKTRTGMSERRVISSERLEDMAAEASLKAWRAPNMECRGYKS